MAKFLDTIEPIDEGRLILRLDEALSDVVDAVGDTTKDGSVTLKLTVEWKNGRALVSPKIYAEVPRHGVAPATYYFGERGTGGLHRENPNQLPLTNILKGTPLVRVADPDDDDNN